MLFNDVQHCSVNFEGRQKCSVDRNKFLLFIDVVRNIESFCHSTKNCPVGACAIDVMDWIWLEFFPNSNSTLIFNLTKSRKKHFISNDESSEEISFSSDLESDYRDHENGDCDEPTRPNSFSDVVYPRALFNSAKVHWTMVSRFATTKIFWMSTH